MVYCLPKRESFQIAKALFRGDFDRDGDKDLAIMGRSDIEGNVTAVSKIRKGFCKY